jgi:hypothetical protein
MDSSHPSESFTHKVAVTVVLCTGWSVSALGATTTDIGCDGVDRLRALEIPAETYSVRAVDHVAVDTVPSSLDAIDTAEATSETAAPFLYLTPRVASVLRDIFDATGEVDDQEVSSSPIAESDTTSDISELIDNAEPAEVEITLPVFQQQMFRIDI